MTMRMLLESEKNEAWYNLEVWGYPTPGEEYPNTIMFDVDGIAYVWYEWISANEILMHVGAHPDHRGLWLTKGVIRKIKYSWEFLGAIRVYVVTSDEYVNSLLTRQGFLQDELGYYLEVGDG